MGKFNEKMSRMMAGRRGGDELNAFISGVALLMIVLTLIFKRPVFYYLFFICFIYSVFRMMSRNIAARYKENEKFLSFFRRMRHPSAGRKKKSTASAQTSGYRFFKCPGCGQVMRAPEGKGRIRVTCTKCGKIFETEV